MEKAPKSCVIFKKEGASVLNNTITIIIIGISCYYYYYIIAIYVYEI